MSFRIKVDPANPGQFFACCGLLELAARFWGDAEGAFSSAGTEFLVNPIGTGRDPSSEKLCEHLGSSSITSTMTDGQIARLKELLNQKKQSLTEEDRVEKERLSNLWERERIHLNAPFDLWIDWWGDTYADGNRLKTWAGKQIVLDLVRAIQKPIKSWSAVPSTRWLNEPASDGSLPLYFDAEIGNQSSSLDVGFSLDALGIRGRTRPMTELAAFIGLQRFRPLVNKLRGTFSYMLWPEPLPPLLAALACCGYLRQQNAKAFEFRLLYRTKYLKSFLTAKPIGV